MLVGGRLVNSEDLSVPPSGIFPFKKGLTLKKSGDRLSFQNSPYSSPEASSP
jgi:hypothetical protein